MLWNRICDPVRSISWSFTTTSSQCCLLVEFWVRKKKMLKIVWNRVSFCCPQRAASYFCSETRFQDFRTPGKMFVSSPQSPPREKSVWWRPLREKRRLLFSGFLPFYLFIISRSRFNELLLAPQWKSTGSEIWYGKVLDKGFENRATQFPPPHPSAFDLIFQCLPGNKVECEDALVYSNNGWKKKLIARWFLQASLQNATELSFLSWFYLLAEPQYSVQIVSM